MLPGVTSHIQVCLDLPSVPQVGLRRLARLIKEWKINWFWTKKVFFLNLINISSYRLICFRPVRFCDSVIITLLKESVNYLRFTPSPQLHVQSYNRNTRTRCEIFSELTIKTPKRRHWCRSGVFIVNFNIFRILL